MSATGPYPLSAIVGQERLIQALLVNAVSPAVGGVLVRGERGTAKSTAVRGLAPLLPPVVAARGEPYPFAPGEVGPGGMVPADAATAPRPAALVELPLGSTLDRLVGALDLARALNGEHAFEAGLLARAHRGILYVDEVNLLPDHLVDALLDAAASGVARVEREAVSVTHAAEFLLVGTMNVEEGELRPQLLDRFGLGVEAAAVTDVVQRAEIVRRRLAFEADPAGFLTRWADAESALAARIAAARRRLGGVVLPERELMRITGACAELGVDGMRGDIVTARAARALAALDGAGEVGERHVREAAELALMHRRRRDPLDDREPSAEDIERALDGADPPPPEDDPPGGGDGGPAPAPRSEGADSGGSTLSADHDDRAPARAGRSAEDDAPARRRSDPGVASVLPAGVLALAGAGCGPSGRRARSVGPAAGAIDTHEARPDADDLALVGSLRARLLSGDPGQLRQHVRAGTESALVVLVVDASGSMGARRALARVKGAVIAVLRDAYARRDRVALIAFQDAQARLLITPGSSPQRAAAAVAALPTGGRTPLAAGLHAAAALIDRERLRDPDRRAIAVVFTDGRVADPAGLVTPASTALGRAANAVEVVDLESGPIRVGCAVTVAAAAGGRVHRLSAARATNRRAA